MELVKQNKWEKTLEKEMTSLILLALSRGTEKYTPDSRPLHPSLPCREVAGLPGQAPSERRFFLLRTRMPVFPCKVMQPAGSSDASNDDALHADREDAEL